MKVFDHIPKNMSTISKKIRMFHIKKQRISQKFTEMLEKIARLQVV